MENDQHDKNLCWQKYIKYIESKVAKYIGLFYKAKPYINKRSLLLLLSFLSLLSFLHTFLY